jgi:hypothetical protein
MKALLNSPVFVALLATAALFAAVGALRFVIGRRIRRGATILDETQRRQLFYLRSVLTSILLVGLLAIWLARLENVLLSLTAVAVAIVIATKELLMCVSGFLMRTTGRLFTHGDWIECNGLRGEVTDHTLLSTRLLETDTGENGYAYTGRTVTIPNSVFLAHPVRAHGLGHQYALHRFRIVLETPVDASAALEWLGRRAEALCAPFADQVRRYNETLERRLGVDIAGPEPTVTVGTTDIGKPMFQVEAGVPVQRAVALERQLTQQFLDAVRRREIPAGELAEPV